MQTQATLNGYALRAQLNPSGLTKLTPGHLIARIFGCWHLEMSRPFTQAGETYRACLNCGAHRQFNLQDWKMFGAYYYPTPAHLRMSSKNGIKRLARRAVSLA